VIGSLPSRNHDSALLHRSSRAVANYKQACDWLVAFTQKRKAGISSRFSLFKKITQYRQLLHHVVRIGADTAKPVRFRSEQQINNWSVRDLTDNLKN
jgi:hypothetical protein